MSTSTERPVCPPGLNWVTSMLTVRDADKAFAFYIDVFGFQEHQRVVNRAGKIAFARMTYRGCNIVILPAGAYKEEAHRGLAPVVTGATSPVTIWVYCDDLEERYRKAKEAGLKILLPLELRFWGDKSFRVEDPDGYIWDFATCVADFGPSKVPPELQTM
jgi:PhnB protein